MQVKVNILQTSNHQSKTLHNESTKKTSKTVTVACSTTLHFILSTFLTLKQLAVARRNMYMTSRFDITYHCVNDCMVPAGCSECDKNHHLQ